MKFEHQKSLIVDPKATSDLLIQCTPEGVKLSIVHEGHTVSAVMAAADAPGLGVMLIQAATIQGMQYAARPAGRVQ